MSDDSVGGNAQIDWKEHLGGEVMQRVNRYLDELHVPGMSICVVDNGQVYTRGFGVARFPDVPATEDTLWYTGSTTKAFLAALFGLLETKKNRLKVTSKIKDFLPDFELQDRATSEQITFEDALSHRTGLPRHDLAYTLDRPLIPTIRHLPPFAQLRATFHYNNIPYGVTQAALEKLEGKTLAELFKEKIWEPLGMNSTFLSLEEVCRDEETKERLARGYDWTDAEAEDSTNGKSGHYVPEFYMNMGELSGSGGIISSVKDYGEFLKAFLAAAKDTPAGESSKPRLFPRKLFKDMTTPRSITKLPSMPPDSENPNNHAIPDLYGLGLMILPHCFPGHILISHPGGMPGFGTNMFMLPDDGFGVVTMTNSVLGGIVAGERVAYELMGKKLGLGDEEIDKIVASLKREMLLNPPVNESDKKEKQPHKHGIIQHELAQSKPLPTESSALCGTYSHPGYGELSIRAVEKEEVDGLKIRRKPHIKKPDDETNHFLLGQLSKSHMFKDVMVFRHESGGFFSLERVVPHGNISDDAVPGLPPVLDGGKPTTILKPTEEAKSGAAYFVVNESGKVEKLGLMTEPEVDKRAKEERMGWEESMVWYDKL